MLVSSCWIILLGLHALVAFEKPVIDGHHDPDLYEVRGNSFSPMA
ncbi:unnamed protein product [Onchocerca flexuosa]|uniref:Secreted protein n=1 Tax=Onchocerca flexuosa TaxID=387005 RepID=A0A183HSV4_9BILA|nr:unnamed protein product [Onchocerca flexuosa]